MNRKHQQALYKFADQYGVPRAIARALISQESGGNPHARSPVGAIGYSQLMPGTARGLGVNPNDPIDNLRGGMKYLGSQLKAFKGNVRLALAAYNAGPGAVQKYGGVPPYSETQNYVKSIMSKASGFQNATRGRVSMQPTRPQQPGIPSIRNMPNLVPRPTAISPRIEAALELSAPSTAATEIYSRLGGLSSRAAEASSAEIPLPAEPLSIPTAAGAKRAGGLTGLTGIRLAQAVQQGGGQKMGKLIFAAGADRAGVKTKKDAIQFGRRVAAVYGRPLTVGTGTNHSQMTVNGNVSQHWTGHALDIPATGRELIRMGQAALIAAGMPAKQARKQRGGLYNVGGRQVIFNTHEGGDHTNHLHIGA